MCIKVAYPCNSGDVHRDLFVLFLSYGFVYDFCNWHVRWQNRDSSVRKKIGQERRPRDKCGTQSFWGCKKMCAHCESLSLPVYGAADMGTTFLSHDMRALKQWWEQIETCQSMIQDRYINHQTRDRKNAAKFRGVTDCYLNLLPSVTILVQSPTQDDISNSRPERVP